MSPSERLKQALNISCNVRLSPDLNHGDSSQLKFCTLLLDIIILFVSLFFSAVILIRFLYLIYSPKLEAVENDQHRLWCLFTRATQ